MRSDELETKEILRQGRVVSLTLFDIDNDKVLKEIGVLTKKFQAGYRNMQRVELAGSPFADDLIT